MNIVKKAFLRDYSFWIFSISIPFFVSHVTFAQCTSGCSVTYNTCANIASISATNGTSGANHVICISPPAGCGNITVGNTALGQYERIVICTNSPTDTVKFIGNFAASGGGSSAANDNTRFVDIYGNAQFTYGGTITWGSRIVINVASTGSLNLKNPTQISFLNSSSMTNAGKITSSSDLIFTSGTTGPMINTGTVNASNISFNGGGLTNSGTIQSNSSLVFATGAGTVLNNGNLLAGCELTITSGLFTNSNYVYSQCNTTVSTAITNNSNFKTEGTLTLNASGTFNFQNGLFESDSLILNGGNINAGIGCAAFIVHKFSSIQNGSGFTSVPANSVGIYDTGNPGFIDNVSVGCGGANPAVPYNGGPYCGVLPLLGVGSMGTGSGCFASLPVTWLSNSATLINDQQIEIYWSTANEFNNNYFTVQRSIDGVNFISVSHEIEAMGKGSLAHDYSFIDNYHCNGIVYYKLMQTDIDGRSSYSSIIEVKRLGFAETINFDVFPNPLTSSSDITLNLNGLESASEILVVLLDHLGNTIYTKAMITEKENLLFTIGSDVDLQKGIYFISASNNQSLVTKKLVVN